jgi:hypothetical protein
MENNDLQIESNFDQLSTLGRKLRAKWTPMTEEEKSYLRSYLKSDPIEHYASGYDSSQPTIGFFMWDECNAERVKQEYPDTMAPDEKEIILEYMSKSTEETSYMGWANSRIDGTMLGSRDMRTPDGKWIFPEKWDTHYVETYNICPPREFVEDALKWKMNC